MSEENEEKPFDAGDPQDVRRRIAAGKRREAGNKVVIRQIMASSEGRAWIYGFLSMCHVYQNPFSENALKMAFMCGEMNVGQRFMADIISAAPEKYLDMLSEQGDKNV